MVGPTARQLQRWAPPRVPPFNEVHVKSWGRKSRSLPFIVLHNYAVAIVSWRRDDEIYRYFVRNAPENIVDDASTAWLQSDARTRALWAPPSLKQNRWGVMCRFASRLVEWSQNEVAVVGPSPYLWATPIMRVRPNSWRQPPRSR